jgi:hypothetical protein
MEKNAFNSCEKAISLAKEKNENLLKDYVAGVAQ